MKLISLAIFLISHLTLSAQVTNYVIDNTFNSGEFYIRGSINSLLSHNDGRILVGGTFSSTSEAGAYSIISENGDNILFNTPFNDFASPSIQFYQNDYLVCGIDLIFLFNAESGPNHSFKFEYQKSAYNGFLGNNVLDAIVEPDNSILVGGRFFTDSVNHNNIESLRQLCRIDSTGARDPVFPMLHCATPVDAQIFTMDTLSDGSLIVSGSFYEFGGYEYNMVGKLNPDFSVDTTFFNSFAPGDVAIILGIDSQDRTWLIFSSTATIENPNENIYFSRLMPNGEIDSTFTPPDFFTYYEGFLYQIGPNQFIELPNGRFIVVGAFTEANGYPRKGLAMLDDDGTVIENAFDNWGADEATWGTWTDDIAGFSEIKALPNGKLLLGGQFSSFGGEPYNCLIRLKPDGFVGVNEKQGRNTLSIYPNPTRDYIRIRLPNKNQRLTRVVFYDLRGRLVQEVSEVESNSEINLSNLPQGMYMVKGITESGVFTGKVLVQ